MILGSHGGDQKHPVGLGGAAKITQPTPGGGSCDINGLRGGLWGGAFLPHGKMGKLGQPLGVVLFMARKIDAASILADRHAIWRDAQTKLVAEGRRMKTPTKDWLERMKLVDDRLGILFGDRSLGDVAKKQPPKRRSTSGKTGIERLTKYRVVS